MVSQWALLSAPASVMADRSRLEAAQVARKGEDGAVVDVEFESLLVAAGVEAASPTGVVCS